MESPTRMPGHTGGHGSARFRDAERLPAGMLEGIQEGREGGGNGDGEEDEGEGPSNRSGNAFGGGAMVERGVVAERDSPGEDSASQASGVAPNDSASVGGGQRWAAGRAGVWWGGGGGGGGRAGCLRRGRVHPPSSCLAAALRPIRPHSNPPLHPPPRSEFRRGKRYKRLQVMLASKQSQATLTAFQRQAWAVTLGLLAAHVACFLILLFELASMTNSVKELDQVRSLGLGAPGPAPGH
jgi:hypothetical protein